MSIETAQATHSLQLNPDYISPMMLVSLCKDYLENYKETLNVNYLHEYHTSHRLLDAIDSELAQTVELNLGC